MSLTTDMNSNTNEIAQEEFLKIIAGQHDTALSLKPKNFMKGMIAKKYYSPKDKIELKRIIKKENYVIRGSATSFAGGTLPHAEENIISSLNFNKISISRNGIATIGSGVTYFELISEAKKAGFEVPCYPVTTHAATIGGFISNSGKAGLNSRGCGYLYDYIEEMEVITPAGETFKVKGNDILDFFGAEGNLGMITEIKLRLLPKETRYIHMYGFDGIEDIIKFVESDDSIYIAYFMNEFALKDFEKEWQIKYPHKYAMIIIDKNWKDDYTKDLREDLTVRGVSYIYPKEIVKWCFKRLNTLELSICKNKDDISIGDGLCEINAISKITRIASRNKIPLFASFGKNEILFRIYTQTKQLLSKYSFRLIMDKIFSSAEAYSVGSLYRSYLKGTKRALRYNDALERYNPKKKNPPRLELYPNNFGNKIKRTMASLFPKKLW